MDNKEYYRQLKLQYYKATKEKIKQNIENSLNDDIYRWLSIRKEIGKIYLEYLDSLGIDIKTLETAEIGKGLFDTLVREYETTIISPYIEAVDNKRVYTYSLNLVNTPTLMKYGPKMRIEDIKSIPKDVNTFLINNPYEKIVGLENFVNKEEIQTIIGIYGQIFDKDKDKKLKMLLELSKKIQNKDFNINYESNNDYYYASLIANRKPKKI